MKIFFIGTVEFSLKALEKLIQLNCTIVGVITKQKSDFNSDFVDLTPICTKNNIPCKYGKDINSEKNVNWIKSLNPDVIFCFGWSSLLKPTILNIPSLGVIGFHPAPLPFNRGRHPIIWSLVLGLEKTASTFFFMDEGADSGDILSQFDIEVKYEDNAQTLYNKITNTALKQIELFIPELFNRTFVKLPQDNSKANYWRKRNKNDGLIDFRMSSRAIYNLVRGLTKPYAGSHVLYKENAIKVWKVKEEFVSLPNIEPGKILGIENNNILIKCYDNAIWIINHEFYDLPVIGEYL